jgi:hypothetical protein
MWRPAIAFVLALAATTVNAQDTRSGQSPARARGDGSRPFLFDARMPGDGSRQRAGGDEKHRKAGAVVMPPKASQPERER